MKNITQNRKHLLFICLFLSFNSLFAQSLSEKLGGVSTDFIIISGNDTLDVDNQMIIKRADYKTKHGFYTDDDGAYGYGYGYQSFHLEFLSKNKINKKKVYRKNVKSHWYCTFHCFDENGNQILEMFKPSDRLKEGSNGAVETPSYIYRFNLIGIPITVLDKTTTIYIEWEHHSRNNKK